ncbi:hypothetical protein F25303_3807 [Fusarium sp. NRRL 25303]|nr:hypothetical protein F25303_3807 [Fusarium sp. NRRL 25303]
MARTQSPRGLGRKGLTGAISVAQDDIRPVKKVKTTTHEANGPLASEAQQTHNCGTNHSNAETHAARPRGATMVARIILENIQRGSEGDVLEARVEDFNAIDHDENPRRNACCEEEEPVITRETSQGEFPESEKRRAAEEALNIAENLETSTKADERSRMVIQMKQIKTKSSARKSKETSKTDEAIELEMLDEQTMIYSLAEDLEPQIQQCYAYF